MQPGGRNVNLQPFCFPLDVLVLKALSWTPLHGFEITCWLDRSGGQLNVDDAALFQALHRMEERGLIGAEWGITETTDGRDTTA